MDEKKTCLELRKINAATAIFIAYGECFLDLRHLQIRQFLLLHLASRPKLINSTLHEAIVATPS
jgi:hypothetical protein